MTPLFDFLRWLFEFAMNDIWRFLGAFLLIQALAKVTTLVKVDGSPTTVKRRKRKARAARVRTPTRPHSGTQRP
jgi:hypothetical protein